MIYLSCSSQKYIFLIFQKKKKKKTGSVRLWETKYFKGITLSLFLISVVANFVFDINSFVALVDSVKRSELMTPSWERSQMQTILTERGEWAALCYNRTRFYQRLWPGFAADLRIKREAFDKAEDCYSMYLAWRCSLGKKQNGYMANKTAAWLNLDMCLVSW